MIRLGRLAAGVVAVSVTASMGWLQPAQADSGLKGVATEQAAMVAGQDRVPQDFPVGKTPAEVVPDPVDENDPGEVIVDVGVQPTAAAPRSSKVGVSASKVNKSDAVAGKVSVQRVAGGDGVGKLQVKAVSGSQLGSFELRVPSRLLTAGLDPARVKVFAHPECYVTRPDDAKCRAEKPTAVRIERDVAQVQLASPAKMVVLAAETAAKGPGGDFSVSKLSATGSWAAGDSTGGFSYAYPLQVPKVAGGLQPNLGLSYSSHSVDGKTFSTNNQGSVVGEGWSLNAGFVERRYTACAKDGGTVPERSGDLCWKDDNAVLSYAGKTNQLVKINVNAWRLQQDDGSRVEHLFGADNGDDNGEYWKLTQPDGTQIFFGKHRAHPGAPATDSTWTVPVYGNQTGEPGYQGEFAKSYAAQAWRWNVDYVVDPRGNAMSYFYSKELNKYGANDNSKSLLYTRDGWLSRIEYGARAGLGTAAAKVEFTMADRCVSRDDKCPAASVANATWWPDVPVDLLCSKESCDRRLSPSFFTLKKLVQLRTFVNPGSGFVEVDRWDFSQSFPEPGDGSRAALWLDKVTYSAAGKDPQPPTRFVGQPMANRVYTTATGAFGNGFKQNKLRITQILSSTGASSVVQYSAPECVYGQVPADDASNTKRCFAAWWLPPYEWELQKEWFHTYTVTQVDEADMFTLSEGKVTKYDYVGSPAWGYDNNPYVEANKRTWRRWLGYQKVVTTVGPSSSAPLRSESLYFRGRDGDGPDGEVKATVTDSKGGTVNDDYALRGRVREQRTFNGQAEVSSSITTYDSSRVTAGSGREAARLVVTGRQDVYKSAEAGQAVHTAAVSRYDERGRLVESDDQGSVSDANDDLCTKTTYAGNEESWLWSLPSTTQTQRGGCSSWSGSPDKQKLVSDQRIFYDGSDRLGAVSKGLATRSDKARDFEGNKPVYSSTSTSHDVFGRAISVTDPLGRTSLTSYIPAEGSIPSEVVSTSPDPDGAGVLSAHQTKTTFDTARQVPIKQIDAAGGVTEATYDNYGRLEKVWTPGFKTSNKPARRYVYKVSGDPKLGPSSITSYKALAGNLEVLEKTDIFDGFVRPVQTQIVTIDTSYDAQGARVDRPGRLISTTEYDIRGLTVGQHGPVFSKDQPTTVFRDIPVGEFPKGTETVFDGAGRAVRTTRTAKGKPQAATTISYGGDRTHTNPPSGTAPQTSIMNARGKQTVLRKYEGKLLGEQFVDYTFSYSPEGALLATKDPRGVTRSYDYDLAGHRTVVSDPDKGRTLATFNAAGEQVSSTNARNQTVTYTFDGMGRPTQMLQGDRVLTATVYDTVRRGSVSSTTRFVEGRQIESRTTAFDEGGRPTKTETVIPEVPGLIDKKLSGIYSQTNAFYTNGLGRRISRPKVGPLNAETVEFTYDDLDRPIGLIESRGSSKPMEYVSGGVYNAYGQSTGHLFGLWDRNRAWAAYYHDDATGLVNKEVYVKEQSKNLDVETEYFRDQSLNITGISTTSRVNADVDYQCFRRDFLGRLSDAWTAATKDCAAGPLGALGGVAPYSLTWVYDRSGNQTSLMNNVSKDKTLWSFGEAIGARPHGPVSQTVTGADGKSATQPYSYDDSGNTTEFHQTPGAVPASLGGKSQMVYDVEDRLVASTSEAGTTKFVYGALGEQIVRAEPGRTVLFLGDTQLELDSKTQKVTGQRSYSFNGRTVALRTQVEGQTQGTVMGLFSDVNNTAGWQFNPGANTITARRTTPYGAVRGTQPVGWVGDRGFVDGKNSPLQGVVRLGDRDYDPVGAKFLQPDRLIDDGDPASWNAYGYGHGDPLGKPDPSGLFPRGIYAGADSGDEGSWKAVQPVQPVQPATGSPADDWSTVPAVRNTPRPLAFTPSAPRSPVNQVRTQVSPFLSYTTNAFDALGGLAVAAQAVVNACFGSVAAFSMKSIAKTGAKHGISGLPQHASKFLSASYRAGSWLMAAKLVSNGSLALAGLGGLFQMVQDLEEGHSFGYAALRGLGNAAGSVVGAYAGAYLLSHAGAAVGALVGPHTAVVVGGLGGIAGGIAGGIGGGMAGTYVGGMIAEDVFGWH